MVRNVKGFTMVELMIVISIIGVLATALIPTFIGAQSKARDTGRSAALANASTSLASFSNDNGYFPGTMNGCLTDSNGSVSLNAYYSNAATPVVITTVAAYFQ
jgi:prepilin-type N-terminal cleavage/methylation domain-containing protein